MTIKLFLLLSAIAAAVGLTALGLLVLSVRAIDNGLIQVTTLAYAVPVLLIGLAAAAAHYLYRGTRTARISVTALIVAGLIAMTAYAVFRWHSESHRVDSSTDKNEGKSPVTPVTNAPATPSRPRSSEPKPKRRRK